MDNYDNLIGMTTSEFASKLAEWMDCKNCPARKLCLDLYCEEAILEWLLTEE